MAELRHHIQRHILQLLIDNRAQRYSQLRPANMEPNQFVYHLKQLIREDLVQKCGDNGYELTEKGRAYADKFDPATFAVPWEVQPRCVLLLAIHDQEKGWLLTRRDKQPTIGKIGFISCDPELGVSILVTAQKYISKQYGLTADFRYTRSGSIMLRSYGRIESYVMYQLLAANDISGVVSDSSSHWFTDDQLVGTTILPSTLPLIRQATESMVVSEFPELTYDLGTTVSDRAILTA